MLGLLSGLKDTFNNGVVDPIRDYLTNGGTRENIGQVLFGGPDKIVPGRVNPAAIGMTMRQVQADRPEPTDGSVIAPTGKEGLMRAVPSVIGEMRQAPTTQKDHGIAGDLFKYATSRQGMLALATALRSYGGNQNAFNDLWNIQDRDERREKEAKGERKKALAAKAFALATAGGGFDKSVYAAVMGGDLDPQDLAALAKGLRKDRGFSGDTPYTWADDEDEPTYGTQRPESTVERLKREAADRRESEFDRRLAETIRYHNMEGGNAARRAATGEVNAGTAAGNLDVHKAAEGRQQSVVSGTAGMPDYLTPIPNYPQ